jgi:hypothetical protein
MRLSTDRPGRLRSAIKPASLVLGAVLLLVAAGIAHGQSLPVRAGNRARRTAAGVNDLRSREMDTTAWNLLLTRYVRDGQVDYAAWKKDGPAALDSVLAAMATHPYANMLTHEPRLAFLINVYNACAIRTILDAWPVRSVKDIPGFFDQKKHAVAGGNYTLNEIEQTLIKGRVDDYPEYHLALVGGARGGPPLRRYAYRGDSLSIQFSGQFRAFAGDTTRCWYDGTNNRLHLSELFQWNAADFERGDKTLPLYVAPLFPLGVTMRILKEEPVVEFIPFDWGLNDAATVGPPK